MRTVTEQLADNARFPLEWEREVNIVGRFIFAHPHWERAFVDHSREDVIGALLRHLKARTCQVLFDEQGGIAAVILYTMFPAENRVHVDHLVGTGEFVIPAALELWRNTCPDFTVSMFRRGVLRTFRPEQFFAPADEQTLTINA